MSGLQDEEPKPIFEGSICALQGSASTEYPAFAYLTNYKEVREVLLHIEPKNCVLSTILAKTISRFVSPEEINDLRNEIYVCIDNTIENIDFIFDQVPASWGLNKKSKDHLKSFFSNQNRNKTIINHFLSYLK